MINIYRTVEMVLTYEDKSLQMKALTNVPINDINDRVTKRLREQQNMAKKFQKKIHEAQLYENIFLFELVQWFKNDFFSWVNVRRCTNCNINMTLAKTYVKQESTENSHLYNVEVYECFKCGRQAEFPRYNDAKILLDTREGRCSEWAQVFTLIVRALGWRARYVYDFLDHEWTEVWSNVTQRWIHCDPCEAVIDDPLIYELGWNKKLTYILAFSCDDIQDVTWRYSSNHKTLCSRRPPCLEKRMLAEILKIRNLLLSKKSSARRNFILKGVISELASLMIVPSAEGQYGGRVSGSYAWRESRNELGFQNNCNIEEERGYVWTPLKYDEDNKEMCIKYCTTNDLYIRDPRGENGLYFGWNNYTFKMANVFRNVERDWNMTYLAKKDQMKNGVVIWKFDLSDTSMVVKCIKIKCPCFVLSLGNVLWEIKSENFPVIKVENISYFETSVLENCNNFTLAAFLGNNLKSNWQHSQLFRQSLAERDFTFSVIITMKESPNT